MTETERYKLLKPDKSEKYNVAVFNDNADKLETALSELKEGQEDGAITTEKIKDGAVTAVKIKNGEITEEKLANNAVTVDKIKAGAVSEEKINNGAVTVDKIKDGSVTKEKLAYRAIERSKIQTKAVGTDEIDDKAIATKHIGDKQINALQLNDNCVQNHHLLDGSVTTEKIEEGAVYGTKLKPATVSQMGGIKLHNKSGKNISGIAVSDDGTAYVSVQSEKGLTRSGSGEVIISAATTDEIEKGTNGYKPIVPSTLPYSVSSVLEKGVDIGHFEDITFKYPSISLSEAKDMYSTALYYDGRIADMDMWYDINGANKSLEIKGGTARSRYSTTHTGEIYLTSEFEQVTYYSGDNKFSFRIIVMLDLPSDTTRRSVISIFNGNTTVQQNGAYGLRIVSKQGTNGTSLVTSPYITKTGKMIVCLSGSNASGDMLLTVRPLDDDLKNASDELTATATLTSPAYIGVYDYEKNFIAQASTTTPITVYAVSIEPGTTESDKLDTEMMIRMRDIMCLTETYPAASIDSENTSGNDQYSSTPQRIGTWINGTPVWRQAFDYTFTDDDISGIKTDGNFMLCSILNVKNTTKVFTLNACATLRVFEDPCMVDDMPLVEWIAPNLWVKVSADFWKNAPNPVPGIYGYIEFVTAKSNLK